MKMYGLDQYENGTLDWSRLTPKERILHALIHGARLTGERASTIGGTRHGGRYIRFIRQDGHPFEVRHIRSGKGGTLYEYSFPEEHINRINEMINQLWKG